MHGLIRIVGPGGALELFGIRLVGVSAETGKKLLFTIVFLLVVWAIRRALRFLTVHTFAERPGSVRFWTRQAIRLFIAILLITGLISIWFNNPSNLASAAAFITAGLAVASQRIITALAGYFIVLRGKTFTVGDRIVMGGVRGDVIALGFMQTTIMEMGQPPSEQADAPSMWVAGRQYTGRIVTITNDKIFDNPVYNYTREFPYIWEEMRLPIPYNSDRHSAERVILDAARRHTLKITELGEESIKELERRYAVKREEMEPRVFYRLTDNWVEMSVRFLTEEHGMRVIKDAISREILDGLDRVHIGIASGTYQVVGMPELQVRIANGAAPVPQT
jgi:small-conductance mechanosensitive channel